MFFLSVNILFLTSISPLSSGQLFQSQINALIELGHSVDCITLYDYPTRQDNIIPLFSQQGNHKQSYFRRNILSPLKSSYYAKKAYSILNRINRFLDWFYGDKIKSSKKTNTLFLYPDEEKPPVNVEFLTSAITKTYDAVVTGFWEGMINTTSLRAIYDKVRCPILIQAPDMAPITGGCYYFGNCDHFKNGCGNCIALGSNKKEDQSYYNFLCKKINYSQINCAFLGNTWMNQFAIDSGLFKNVFLNEISIDDTIFVEGNRGDVRKKHHISEESFVILVASSMLPRKGNKDIINILHTIPTHFNNSDLNRIQVVIIGDNYLRDNLKDLPFSVRHLGRVGIDLLVECYQMSDIFLSTSRDDAGPSMVNQSIMCGTPVVCYDNGTAMDVIENMKSGFKCPVGDWTQLLKGIRKIMQLDAREYSHLRITTHAIAISHNSIKAGVENLIKCIDTMKTYSNEINYDL